MAAAPKPDNSIPFASVTVIGTGLLGASLALALRARGFAGPIVGVARQPATRAAAAALGCFDELTDDAAAAAVKQTAGADPNPHLIMLATPLGPYEAILTQLRAARVEGPQVVISDVGSVKGSVCELVQRVLQRPERFVGGHPMAGGEKSGPGAACAELFAGKPCVLTPTDRTEAAALALVTGLWRTLGADVLQLTPAEHDRQVAAASHLPHAVAAALVHIAATHQALEVASTGFRDTTRIAGGDPAMWRDIFTHNALALSDALADLLNTLGQLQQALNRGDQQAAAALFAWLHEAQALREQWRQANPCANRE
jgi:prephenate dehydrogenase